MTDPAIRTEGLTKRFDQVRAVDGISFEVPRGEGVAQDQPQEGRDQDGRGYPQGQDGVADDHRQGLNRRESKDRRGFNRPRLSARARACATPDG